MTTPTLQLQYLMSPLVPLLEGGTEDIAINTPGTAWVRRDGCWTPFDVPTLDYDALLNMTIMAASISQQDVGPRNPLLFTDVPMANSPPLRLMAILPPAVEPGTVSWTIRQPGDRIHSIDEFPTRYNTERWNHWRRRRENRDHAPALALYDAGDLTGFLRHVVKARYNLLLCGATGAGKTSAGISMIDAIPEGERIITVENAREYRLKHPNKLHLLYSQADQGVAQISQKDLQRASLRSRPDRVLVQELLDSEAAATYVEEVVSGHPGSITTIHGRDAAQAFKRLFNMVKASGAGSAQEDATVVGMLASVVDVIIPFRNDAAVFSIGEVWFAPDAARRGESVGDLLRDVD